MARIADVIASVNTLRPNQYSDATKTRWLSDCDGMIHSELASGYVRSDDMPETFAGYDEATDPQTELIVKAPYDVLYRHYLMSQIDFHNGELPKYGNSSAQFNAALLAYKNWFNRTHMPVDKADHFKL